MTGAESREQAFILLFEKSFNEDVPAEKIYELALECEAIQDSTFTHNLFTSACEHIEVLDSTIEDYSKGWTKSRLSRVTLTVLRLAICEISWFEKTPVKVALSDAVKLCEKYASAEESAFVNGILGTFVKDKE